jgi:hypothetical protein
MATKRLRNLSTNLSAWIQAQIGSGCPSATGDVFFSTPVGSSTSQFITWLQDNGVDGQHLFTDVKKAYAAMVEGRNDTLVLMPGSHVVTEAQTWDKRYSNVIGTHTGKMNQRSRITNSTVSVSPMITISDEGSLYKNVLFSQEGSHATSCAICVYVTGHRPIFDNCGFRNIGALAVVDNSHRSLKVSAAYDVTFRNCQIGETSYSAVTATSYVIEFAGSQGGKYMFENCLILGAGSANASFLKIPADAGGFWLFEKCNFHNANTAMTQAFAITATSNDVVLLKDCLVSGATALETSDSGILYGNDVGGAATGQRRVALTG